MARNSLLYADVPLRNYTLTLSTVLMVERRISDDEGGVER